MADRSISTKVAIEGDSQYKSALKAIAQGIKEVESELNLAKSAFSDNANSMQALTEKGSALQSMYDAYNNKLSTLQAALSNAQQAQQKWAAAVSETKEKLENNSTAMQQNAEQIAADKARLSELETELESAKAKFEELANSQQVSSEEADAVVDSITGMEDEMQQLQNDITQCESANQNFASSETELTSALNGQERAYNTATTAASKYQTDVNNTKAQLNGLDSEIQKNSQYLNEAKSSADGCASSIDKYGNEIKETGEQAQEATDSMQQLSDSAQAVTSVMMASGVAQAVSEITDALQECVQTAADFEYTMAAVQAVSGASSEQMSQLSEQARDWASSTIYSAQDIAESYETMGRAGWNAEQMLDGMSGVMSLAAASGESLGDMTQITTTALVAFGESASSASHFADVLAETAADSNTTVGQLGNAFTAVGTTAGTLGYSIDDVSVALGAMADAGLSGELAGTGLATMLTRMSGANAKAASTMEDLNLSMYNADGSAKDLATFLDELRGAFEGLTQEEQENLAYNLAGQRGMKSLLAIVNTSSSTWDNLTTSIENCNGAAESMSDIRLDTMTGTTKLLQDAVEELQISFGDKLTPAVETAESALTSLVSWFGDAIEDSDALAPALTGAAIALGTFTVGMTAAAAAIKVVKALEGATMFAEMATPIGLVSAALGGLAALFIGVSSSLKTAETGFETYNTQIDAAVSTYNEEHAAIQETSQDITDMCARLDELTSKDSLNAAETQELNSIVNSLNEAIPDLGLSYNDLTNELNMDTDAIIANAQAMANEQEYVALQSELIELEKQRSTIEGNVADARQDYIDAQNALNAATKDQAEIAAMTTGELIEYNGEIEALNQDVDFYWGQLQKAEAEQDEFNAQVDQISGDMAELGGSTEDAAESTDGYADSAEEAAEATDEEASALEEANAKLREIGSAAIDARYSTGDLREEYNALVQEFNAVASSGDAALAALVEQKLELLNYAATMQELTDAFGNLESYAGYTQSEIANYLIAMGVSVDDFAATVEQNFETICNGFEELDTTSGASLQTITSNLSSNAESYSTWLDSIAKAWDKAVASGDEGAMGLVQSLYDAGPEYSAAAKELADSGPKELAAAGADWQAAQDQAIRSALMAYAQDAGISYEAAYDLAHNGAIAFNEASGEYEEAGTANGEAYNTGVGEATTTTEEAVDQVVSSALGRIENQTGQFEDAGGVLVDAIAVGMVENTDIITSNAETMISTGIAGIDSDSLGSSAGTAIAVSIGTALTSESGTIESAADMAITTAMSTVSANDESYAEDVGIILAEGIATGITDTQDSVTTAMDTVVTEANSSAADKESEFETTGNVLADAVASGMTDETETVVAAAETVADTTSAAVTNKQGDFQTAGSVLATATSTGISSGEGEITGAAESVVDSAATSAASTAESGGQTIGYYMDAGLQAGILGNASGAISAAVQVAVSAYEAACAALDIASPSKKMEEVGMYYDLGFAEGIKNYASVAEDEAEDAADEVLKAAKDALANYKIYNEMSAEQEATYWATIREEITEGTQARIDADELYLKAREEMDEEAAAAAEAAQAARDEAAEEQEKKTQKRNEIIASLDEALIDYENDVQKAFEDWGEAYQKELDSLTESIAGAIGIFDEFESSTDLTTSQLISNLQSQVDGMQQWEDDLDSIAARGVGADFINMLQDLGVDSAAEIHLISQMTDEELSEYVDLWQQKNALAAQEAETELNGLRSGQSDILDEINQDLMDSIAEADEEYSQACADLREDALSELDDMPDAFEEIGTAAGEAIANGLLSQVSNVSSAAASLAAAALQASSTIAAGADLSEVAAATNDATAQTMTVGSMMSSLPTNDAKTINIVQNIYSQKTTAADQQKAAIRAAKKGMVNL